jgi:SAM-dependent methyltransferase
MQIKECPICKSTNRKLILKFKNSFQFIHNRFNPFTLEKYQCIECAHIYAAKSDNYLLDEHYESTRDADQTLIYNMKENLDHTFLNLVKWMIDSTQLDKSSIKRILDIGCGKCDLLHCFSNKFNHAELFGIDYSAQVQAFGKSKGLNNIIAGDIYSENFNFTKFDIISATGVMEHQIDLSKFIEKIISLLNINGYLLIEVPDSISILRNRTDLKSKSMHDICNDEHIHHFNKNNIIELFKNNGFNFLDSRQITRGDWDDINIVMQYNGEEPEEQNININEKNMIFNTFNDKREMEISRLNSIISDFNSIGIYGAGWHTTKVLPSYYELDFSQIDIIFDQDPRKAGEKIYGIDICYPKKSKLNAVDAIIISSINMSESINDYLTSHINSNSRMINLYE